ncbi:galactose oxidase [Cellulophaga baltica]|uniref:Kelch repeat-containing protein n=1 Tax=Cellulophaga TaxID=104264 RepID=UPI001C0664F3|nr:MULTISPECIES: kelch repeat-containing protein [Cellulophaga]MBU2997280.1 galactose oxidase [Cellulophaga baltica]MDO6768678.1 kelch repeat-containing protein [Cellulophaga sp. 1_MG-2023]
MKKIEYRFRILSLFFMATLLLTSCSNDDDDDDGNWVDMSTFDGSPRSGTAYFTINDVGYIGAGYDGDDYLNSFWSYDFAGNFWSQKADFLGSERSSAAGFQVDGTGYIGSGYNETEYELYDFYSYNTGTNTWTQIASLPETEARRGAVAFGINGAGYFGTGNDGDNDLKDFWKYTPGTDTWAELEGFGGDKRVNAVTFTINDLVYLGTGISSGSYPTDFWYFDPSTETWTELLELDEEDDYAITRDNAVAFNLNGYGYIATGDRSGATTSVWEYDPSDDTWDDKTSFEGTSREGAVAFTNGSRAFVGLGKSGTLYLDDLDEFFPFDEYDDED